MTTDAQIQQLLRAMREQTEVLKKIERHLQPKVADAAPIRRPNLQEPAGADYPTIFLDQETGQGSSSVPDGVEPMSEND